MSTANAQLYIGHPKNVSNPKTRDHWLDVYNGVVVFDPQVVHAQLNEARDQIRKAKEANKDILVLCEKDLYKEEIEVLAESAGFFYLNHNIPS